MRMFKVAALLLTLVGLGFSYIDEQSQTTPQNSPAPIHLPPDAAAVRAEVQKIEDSLPNIPDRGAALFLLAK
jgi:hypothetical protein